MLKNMAMRLSSSRSADLRTAADAYRERVVALDPQDEYAREVLESRKRADAGRGVRQKLHTKKIELVGGEAALAERAGGDWRKRDRLLRQVEYDAVSSLPENERFMLLPGMAVTAYSLALYFDHAEKDRATAELLWTNARKYSEDALKIAEKLHDHPQYGVAIYNANITLSALAMWPGGDKERAVRHLRAASMAPVSTDQPIEPIGGNTHLLADLIKYGERDAVLEFLDRMAPKSGRRGKDVAESAAAIRAGRMPQWYQYRNARLMQ